MKKKLLVLLLMLLVVPTLVSADVGIPERSNYNIKITNTSGAYMYDYSYDGDTYNKTSTLLAPGTICESSFSYGKYLEAKCGDKLGYLLADDITPILDASKLEFKKYKKQYYAYKETTVYEYPYFASKVAGTIAKGETFDINICQTESFDSWAYVNVNGVKGWIYALYGTTAEIGLDGKSAIATVVAVEEGEFYVVYTDVDLYTEPMEQGEKVNAYLEYGKTYKYKYNYNQVYNEYVQVEVDGKLVWVNNYLEAGKSDAKMIITDASKVALYGRALDKDSRVKTLLNDNTLYDIKIAYELNHGDGWYLINNGTSDLWIAMDVDYDDEVEVGAYIYSPFEYYSNMTVDYYEDYTMTKKAGTFEASKKYVADYLFSADIYYAEGYGFFKLSEDDLNKLVREEINKEEEPTQDIEPAVIARDEENNFIIYIVCGSIVLALTIVVIIVLIARMRKGNKEETKVEVKEEKRD